MSYSVKIVKNDTGKVVCDYDNACAVMAAIGTGEGVHQICGVDCNSLHLYATVSSLQELLKKMVVEHPEIETIAKLEGVLFDIEKYLQDKGK